MREFTLYPTHKFTWKVLMAAPINGRAGKNLEASFIAPSTPSLNVQIDLEKVTFISKQCYMTISFF